MLKLQRICERGGFHVAKLLSPLRRDERMAKKALLYSDQGGLLLHNTAPFLPFVPIADHFCSGLFSHSTRFYRPEIVREGTENILNHCLSRTAASSALG